MGNCWVFGGPVPICFCNLQYCIYVFTIRTKPVAFLFFFVFWYFYRFLPPPLLPPFLRYIHATVERSNILKDSIAPDAKPNLFFFFLFVTAPVKRDNSRPELPSTPDLYTPYSASLFPMQDLPKSRYDLQEIEEIRFV